MVKIEKLTPGTIVYVQRDGAKRRVFLNQLITRDELASMEVESGTVTYSIDEEVIEEKSAEQVPVQQTLDLETKVATTDEVETVKVEPVTPAPVIVKPATRTVTKTK